MDFGWLLCVDVDLSIIKNLTDRGFDNGGVSVFVEAWCVWVISVPST